MFSSRRPRRLLGYTLLTFAICLPIAGLAEAASQSATQPLAPAVYGGGSALLGLGLARLGVRFVRNRRSYHDYRASTVLELGDQERFMR
jgi:hypothetical protein